MSRSLGLILGLALFGVGFCWGALTIAREVFPFDLVHKAAMSTGLAPQDSFFGKARTNRASDSMLASLGYVHASPDTNTSATDVTLNDDRAYSGLNLYNESEGDFIRLIDMKGVIVHEWNYEHPADGLHHAELLPNGDVILTNQNYEVARLDKDSKVLWRRKMQAHHDLWVNADGSIWAINRKAARVPEYDEDRAVMDDSLVHLTPGGELIEEFFLLDVVLESPYRFLLPEPSADIGIEGEGRPLDLLHTNHVEEFDGSLVRFSPLFAGGNLLVSMRHINSIMILDGETHEILWLWGPTNIGWQHHPRLLSSGRILLFDNGFDESRVIEIEVPSGKIHWQYREGRSFFAAWGGANQRLPNGNTLITETSAGYAFEVTPAGEKVWEFANPHFTESGDRRVNIWRMTRFDREALTFLN